MKKLFTFIAAALVSASAFADATYHSPGVKFAGAPFEYVNLSNALVSGQETTTGATGKYGISPEYPWISYNYSASTLVSGGGEVSRGGIWVSSNPIWMTGEFAYMVDDAQKWVGSPKFEVGYVKGETYLAKLCPKSMTFNVTATTRIDLLLTGGGSNTNDADIIVKKADGTVVKTIYVEPMVGKSNKNNANNTNSKWAVVDGLDAAESYQITVAPSTKNATLQVEQMNELEEVEKVDKPITEVLGADVNFGQDIELAADKKVCNIKAGAVYVAALHIFGADLTVNSKKPMAPISDTYFSPVGNKLSGAAFAYVNMSNTLQNGVDTLTTFDASGNASNSGKYSINNSYPWITYNYTASILDGKYNAKTYKIDGGKCEVSRGGYYSSINPLTGAAEVVYMTDDGGAWLGSPKAEVGYVKGETYLASLNPKSVTYNIKEAKKVEILLTGAGSNTNDADIIVKKADGTVVNTIYVEPMAGKSNKNNGSQSNSTMAVVDGLDVAESYQITVATSSKNAQLQVEQMNDLEETEKVYKPIADVLGDVNFGQDIELAADKKVCNVKAGSVAVLALRVYGEDDAVDGLEASIAAAINAGQNSISLTKGLDYQLKATAAVEQTEFTINGNGATVVVADGAQITTKKSLTLDNVVIDATASKIAPIAMAAKETLTAADTTALYTYNIVETPAVLYTEEEAKAANEASGASEGEPEYIKAGDVKTPATTTLTPKYEGANQKVFEAQLIAIRNSEIKTAAAIINGGNAPWALRKLDIDNSIIERTTKTGDPMINFFGGANSIQDINIQNSTIYADSTSTDFYFLRYSNASNAQPKKVFGNDNNRASWVMLNNTFVNMPSNKDFANNYVTVNTDTLTWKGNVFANTWRLQKVRNCTNNFTAADNTICGGVNTVDATDASKWATEDAEMGIYVNAEGKNFVPDSYSLTGEKKYGDPRYLSSMAPATEISKLIRNKETLVLDPAVAYTLNAPANALADKVVTIEGNGASITVGAEGQLVAKTGIIVDNVKMDASESALAPIAMAPKAALTAADTLAFYTYTTVEVPAVLYTEEEAKAANEASGAAEGEDEYVKAGDVKTPATTTLSPKYEGASQKVFEAQFIAIRNSEIKTGNSVISGGDAPWALRKLDIYNSIIEFTKNNKADKCENISWYGGANSIQAITMTNNTFYCDSVKNNAYFLRYSNASNAQPQKVWGTDGTASWTMASNTFVNIASNGQFANNYSNKNNVTLDFKKNVFANTRYLQKIGGSCVRNFEASENVICGGVNTVDATDATKWATEETAEYLGVYVNETGSNFVPTVNSIAVRDQMGDPRWLTERPAESYVDPTPTAIQTVAAPESNDGRAYNIAGQRVGNNAKGLIIKNGKKYIVK